MLISFAAALVLLSSPQGPTQAASAPLDITRVQPGPITIVRDDNSVSVSWPDETNRKWRATFSLDPSQPLVTSIGPEADGEPVVRGARPFYRGERKTPRRVVRVLRRSHQSPRRHAPRPEYVGATRRRRAQRR
jgi:hypothetical protein